MKQSSNNLPLQVNESFTFDMDWSIQIVVTQIQFLKQRSTT